LGDRKTPDDKNKVSIPETDVTAFCLWLKEETKPFVGKVTLSKRLTSVPAVLFGQVSASMRMMMQMMQQQQESSADAQMQMEAMSHNQTLEINPSHPIMVKLNELRKVDSSKASNVSKQMLDNVLLSSGVPFDMQKSAARNLGIIDDFLEMKVQSLPRK